ncbi:MAG: glycosyltransferase family 4 protein [Sarcina sp.]
MKKALQVASVASMIKQFNMENIKLLQKLGYSVEIAANFDIGSTMSVKKIKDFENELKNINVEIHKVSFSRTIINKKNIKAYKWLLKIIKSGNYDIIHCHSPIGGVLTRLASITYRKNGLRVIYTAHGFHFYKGAPIKNWLIYFPVEWICSFFTDTLITINREDFFLAKKFMKAKEILYVPGIGVDVTKCTKFNKNEKKSQLGIENELVFLSVGELIPRKNHELVINALSKIKDIKIKYLICGIGELELELKSLVKMHNLEGCVQFLGYRTDIRELLNIADLFIFPSRQEGLPVALMEAMVQGVPIICSNIRGNIDLISNEKSGILFKENDLDDLILGIKKFVNQNSYTRNKFNMKKIEGFSKAVIGKQMCNLYEKI